MRSASPNRLSSDVTAWPRRSGGAIAPRRKIPITARDGVVRKEVDTGHADEPLQVYRMPQMYGPAALRK